MKKIFNYIIKNESEELKINVKKIIIHSIISIILLILFFGSWGTIGAGKRGVLLQFGAVQDKIIDEGFYFKIPLIQKVKKIEVRTVKMEVLALAYSKDIQTVESLIALNYHLNPDKVNKLFQEIGIDFENRVISPAVQESVKATTAKFTAQDLIEKREQVRDEIKASLTERLAEKNIIVDAFSIVNFDFSDEYEKAVEAKQVSQQNALKADNDLKRIKIEAEQRVAQATAEAEAIKIQAQAITQQGGKDYVNLKWIEAWQNGGSQVPTTIIGNTEGSSFLFNISK